MEDVDLGFRTDRVLTMRVPLPEARYPDPARRVRFFKELISRLRALPGVEAVGVSSSLHPFGGLTTPVEAVGGRPDDRPAVVHLASADYPRTLGIRLRQGRYLSESDMDRVLPVALVNETFARIGFDDQPAVGRRIRIPRLSEPPYSRPDASFEIVGVVADTLNRGITSEISPEVYLPFTLAGHSDRVVVLPAQDAAAILKPAVGAVYAIDPEQPVTDLLPMDRALDDFVYAEPRFNVVLFSVCAALGLVLAVIGVYSVMARSVARQVHEVGVRMALGASPGAVFGMVVGRGARLLAIGIALGLMASVFASRVLEGYVWRVSTVDGLTLGGVSTLILLAGLQACVWPARRAARVSPLAALKSD